MLLFQGEHLPKNVSRPVPSAFVATTLARPPPNR